MAEGSKPLFVNYRTGRPTVVVDGIGTASISSSQIHIGTASLSVDQLPITSSILDSISTSPGAILYRDTTFWVALAPSTGEQLLRVSSSGGNPSWTNIITTLAEGTITTTTSEIVLATSIAQRFSRLEVQLSSISFNTGGAGFAIQVGTSAGFDSTAANYFSFNFSGLLAQATMFGPIVNTTGDVSNGTVGIEAYQSDSRPRSYGFIHLVGGTGNVFYGSYRSAGPIVSLRLITTLSANPVFNGGSYRVYGII